ncbi:MAG: hypothetical protein KIT72_10395 [Polyangiaceae bacterium]|nr:hypothetical protein [Polyangiaceae bacterium]MCW5790821.1 hypothetical protein [Polyangiaceae bacterium]
MARRRLDPGWLAFGVALLVRAVVVLLSAERFPAAADGAFYQVVAERIAQGDGYTWLWPDGAVTYAAHYPIGYPALLGAVYAVFGAAPWVAMTVAALLGALSALAASRLVGSLGRRAALAAGLGVALHPSLVLYTPALMTEGVVGSGVLLLGWLTLARGRAGRWGWLLAGLGLGVLCLFRPQVILLAPALAWLATPARRAGGGAPARAISTEKLTDEPSHAYQTEKLTDPSRALRTEPRISDPRGDNSTVELTESVARARLGGSLRWLARAAAITLVALLVTSPWTARNCAKMDRCVWVSANGGWNLLIGTGPGATGAWVPVEEVGFPDECREVWGEAEKDACFSRAGRRYLQRDFLRWLALIPKKLSYTFDYGDASGWYLSQSNPEAFGERARTVAFVAELVGLRLTALVLFVGLVRLALRQAQGRRARSLVMGLIVLGAPWLLLEWLWPTYLVVLVLALWLRPRHPALVLGLWTLATTALVHAVFFGASRYALVAAPALVASAVAAWVLTGRREEGDTRGNQGAAPGGEADAADYDRGSRPSPGASHRQ